MSDVAPYIPGEIAQLTEATWIVERRFLNLVKEKTGKTISLEDFLNEMSGLIRDIARCCRQIGEMQERRDIGFSAVAELKEADRHFLWLYRRIRLEQFFFQKMDLEAKLRGFISDQGFEIYQEILDMEAAERAFLAVGDVGIRRLLSDEEESTAVHAGQPEQMTEQTERAGAAQEAAGHPLRGHRARGPGSGSSSITTGRTW